MYRLIKDYEHQSELINLWHLSKVPTSGVSSGRHYRRLLWTSDEFHKLHPEYSGTAIYKDLDAQVR